MQILIACILACFGGFIFWVNRSRPVGVPRCAVTFSAGLLHIRGVADEGKLGLLPKSGTHRTDKAGNVGEEEDAVEEDDFRLQPSPTGGPGPVDTLKRARQQVWHDEKNIQEHRLLRVEADKPLHVLILHDTEIGGEEDDNLQKAKVEPKFNDRFERE